MLLVLDVLLPVFYYLLLRVFSVYLSLYSTYVTMSISIGLYPNLDLWNANELHYINHTALPPTHIRHKIYSKFYDFDLQYLDHKIVFLS
jgi:hypothetical protein